MRTAQRFRVLALLGVLPAALVLAAPSAGATTRHSAPALVASCSAGQLIANPGFEDGTSRPWTTTAGVIQANGPTETAHSGTYFAWLDGYGTSHTDTMSLSVTLPAGCTSYVLSFWLHIDTDETTTTTAYDTLTVQVGTVTLARYSNLDAAPGYTQKSFNLGAFAGQTVTIKFTAVEDSSLQTSFCIDDITLTVS